MKMRVIDTKNAISSLTALRETLSNELAHTERYIEILSASTEIDPSIDANGELAAIYRAAGAQLRSGMASLDEVFDWIYFTAEEEYPNKTAYVQFPPHLYLVPNGKTL
jgi:hypothetical protein